MIRKSLAELSTATIIFLAISACKATGGSRSALESAIQPPSLPHTAMKWPTVSQLTEIRAEALRAVTSAKGKNPTVVYINMYPASTAGSSGCADQVAVELGLSYDPENSDDQPRAAGFYSKPDETKNCSRQSELIMDAGRAIDNFLGMRPIDETGKLSDLVKLEPAKFLDNMRGTIKLDNSRAWNLFLKTILTPDTLDSVQYQIEMLCLDRTTATGVYNAGDGKPAADSIPAGGPPLCPNAQR